MAWLQGRLARKASWAGRLRSRLRLQTRIPAVTKAGSMKNGHLFPDGRVCFRGLTLPQVSDQSVLDAYPVLSLSPDLAQLQGEKRSIRRERTT